MRFSKLYVKTLKETPKEAEVISHKLMLRSGMMKKLASGVYSYLPLGYRVLKKVENIVREEMTNAGAQEVFMPVLQPAELWKESGRWDTMGAEMMRIKDRHQRDFALGPTHEEVITDIIRNDISSYKALPVNLFQIQTKFRDERRPRFGLMRGREFLMKDAYSFHATKESLDEEYLNMKQAYENIFNRCGLKFRAVEADAGNIGGSTTHEFHVLAESGEDDIFFCNSCDYAANSEKATSAIDLTKQTDEVKELETVETPNASSIEDVSKFLNIDITKTIKAMAFKYNQGEETKYVLSLIRGDFEVNEVKLKNILNASSDLTLINEEEFENLGLYKGFAGPHGEINEDLVIITDSTVEAIVNGVIGANKKDVHYINANIGRDFEANQIADIRLVKVGEKCPHCEGTLEVARGIEVGHIFQLGTKYAEALGAKILDENGKSQTITMGCYGIGVSRIVAATIEQNYDDWGIVWPKSVSPFTVDVIPANMKNADQVALADEIYSTLKSNNIETIIDDRNERPGFKFKDADLIGFPLKVIVGKKALEGIVEIKDRKTNTATEVSKDEVLTFIQNYLSNN